MKFYLIILYHLYKYLFLLFSLETIFNIFFTMRAPNWVCWALCFLNGCLFISIFPNTADHIFKRWPFNKMYLK